MVPRKKYAHSWDGWDNIERRLNLHHNRLVHTILRGCDAKGREHLDEARAYLIRLENMKPPPRGTVRYPTGYKANYRRKFDYAKSDLRSKIARARAQCK